MEASPDPLLPVRCLSLAGHGKAFTMFRRLILFLLIAFAAAILAVRVRSKPLSVVEMLFTHADGSPCEQPCLFGITPGQTKYRDVDTLLTMHPMIAKKYAKSVPWLIEGTPIRVGRGLLSGNRVMIRVARDSNNIVVIADFFLASLTALEGETGVPVSDLKDVINRVGEPATYDATDGATFYVFPKQGLVVFVRNTKLINENYQPMPDEQVTYLEIFDPIKSPQKDKAGWKWCGFNAGRRNDPTRCPNEVSLDLTPAR
jgi:hypothetical protein